MSGRIPALTSSLDAWRARSNRTPNADKIVSGGGDGEEAATGYSIGLRAFRHLETECGRERIMGHVFGDPETARRVARWWLQAIPLATDRTHPINGPGNGGAYAQTYLNAIKRDPKIDQVGVRRFPSLFSGDKAYEAVIFNGGDYHPMDRGIAGGVMGRDLLFLKDNRHLGGEVERAYQALAEFVLQDWEPRSAALAKMEYGSNAPPYWYTQPLRHVIYSDFCYYKALYLVTGESYYSEQAEAVKAYFEAEWEIIPLPDGREGVVGPHGVNPFFAVRGSSTRFTGWHNSVYTLETTIPCAIWDAMTGSDMISDYKGVERLGNTIYWTLPKFGWTWREHGGHMAVNIGGGGANQGLPTQKIVQFSDGSSVPAEGGIGELGRTQSIVPAWRGVGFAAGAWSTIPDYEEKVRAMFADNQARQPQRGGLHTAVLLFEARKNGMLPGFK